MVSGGHACGPDAAVRVDPAELTGYLTALYQDAGTSPRIGRIIAHAQVEADLRGITSHGSRLAPGYAAKLRHGALNPRPRMVVVTDGGAAVSIDADHAPGPVAAHAAMSTCVRRARTFGAAAVTVCQAGHAGALGIYATLAAWRGMVGVLIGQTSAASVALHGDSQPLLGNTALSVAVPGADWREPVLVDMAMGALSWGAVNQHRAHQDLLPENCALDQHGASTRDPEQAAVLLPFGGIRGQALAIVAELLAGALTGSGALPRGHDGRGLLCLAISPRHLGVGDRLPASVEQVARAVRDRHVPTGRMPGDRSWAQRAASLTGGITLDVRDVHALIAAGQPGTPAPASWHTALTCHDGNPPDQLEDPGPITAVRDHSSRRRYERQGKPAGDAEPQSPRR